MSDNNASVEQNISSVANVQNQVAPNATRLRNRKKRRRKKAKNAKAISDNIPDISCSTTSTIVKKNKLRTSIDVYNRLHWDETLDLDRRRIIIVHHDKNQRLVNLPFLDWIPIDNGGDIPFHRIARYEYNGYVLWNRAKRIDNIFKNSGVQTLDFQTIVESKYHKMNDENKNEMNDSLHVDNQYIHTMQFFADLRMMNETNENKAEIENETNSFHPQFVQLFNNSLNDIIHESFSNLRSNSLHHLSRVLCYEYLSFVPCLQHSSLSYMLFGSSLMQLDTYASDLDVTIIETKESNLDLNQRQNCIKLLMDVEQQLLNLPSIICQLNGNVEEQQDFIKIQPSLNEKIQQLSNAVIVNDSTVNCIIIKPHLKRMVFDAVIPTAVFEFVIVVHRIMNEDNDEYAVSMDITVSMNDTSILVQRTEQLLTWMNRHCLLSNGDLRIHQFLFAVKCWTQTFNINSSVLSTINGYGWINIALFFLINKYKVQFYNNDNNDDECLCAYPNIEIPAEMTTAQLWLEFIEMLHEWICFNEDIIHNEHSIVRKGMNVCCGSWIDNPRRHALYVLDPFAINSEMDNLAKCVRIKKGIPSLIHAIQSTVQQLQFAVESQDMKWIASVFKSENISSQIEMKMHSSKLLSWQQLKQLNIPLRDWIYCSSDNDKHSFTVCHFNILAQSLTTGTTPHTSFKVDDKFLAWQYRSTRILYEILQYKPDIINMCEVDEQYFYSFFVPNLLQFGYCGIFYRKNCPSHVAKNVNNCNQRRKRSWHTPKDGCCIFWKTDKFQLLDEYRCILGEARKSYHIALCARLQYISCETNVVFDVWSTHLKAGRNNESENWRLAQLKTVFYHMKKYSYGKPIILCADLNAHFEDMINDSGVNVIAKLYPFLVNYHSNKKYMEINKNAKNKSMVKKLMWDSIHSLAFEQMGQKDIEPVYTTWAGWNDREVKCTLDYMFIGGWNDIMNENTDILPLLKVRAVLDIWNESLVEAFECKLPNEIYPSDHILIAAQLSINI